MRPSIPPTKPLHCRLTGVNRSTGYHEMTAYNQVHRSKLSLVVLLCLLLFGITTAHAAGWTEEKKKAITDYMHEIRRDWTAQDTELLATGKIPHAESASNVYIGGKPVQPLLTADDGRRIPIEVIGESVLINGKDISGNLGSKTTYGSNSPIIEDIRNSQITTGNASPLSKDSGTSYSINISLSVALTVSVAANLYFLWRRRRSNRKLPAHKAEGTKEDARIKA